MPLQMVLLKIWKNISNICLLNDSHNMISCTFKNLENVRILTLSQILAYSVNYLKYIYLIIILILNTKILIRVIAGWWNCE